MAVAGIRGDSPDSLMPGVSAKSGAEDSAAKLPVATAGKTDKAPPTSVALQKSRRFIVLIRPGRLWEVQPNPSLTNPDPLTCVPVTKA